MTVFMILLALVLVGVDQASKLWAIANLKNGGSISVIPNVFEFHYTDNRGVAFSMLQGQRWLFIPLTIIVSLLILVILLRSPLRRYKLFSFTCVLILAGAVGNLIDRIFYGFVVDFLYFSLIDFPIFNFADCCVVIGAILLFTFTLFGLKGEEDTPLRTLLFGIPVRKKEKTDG